MSVHYEHRQFGWVTVIALLPGLLLALATVRFAGAPAGVTLALVAIALLGALFASLTVEVDAESIRVSFTGGVVHRTIPLRDVREQRIVRSPWYYGWGIHRYPGGGWLWNVAGYDAVELTLAGGRLFRIGTDQPHALSLAIAHAAPHAASAGSASAEPQKRRSNGPVLVVAALLLVAGLLLAWMFRRQMADPVVTVSGGVLSVDTPFYGDSWRLADLTAVSLEQQLPSVERRTNGFAASGLLRGWFDVCGLGSGRLFVDAAQPPFILLRTKTGFVILNFSDAARTRALYGQLAGEVQQARR